MAQVEQLILIDDFDGSEAAETIRFGLDGADYLIELNRENAAHMRQILRPFIEAGRHVPHLVTPPSTWPSSRPPVRQKTTGAAARGHTKHVRQWAQRNGIGMLGDRSRIPEKIFDLYDQAMPPHRKEKKSPRS